ncbi:G-protein coupled receptor GRL101-like [Amphiura filiformis]|uniref:G-protein coupled receptor GRL101-like n=1 Tax=Amphiura filiformis TaxID=82378 RepID=UPI003B219084
MTDFELEAGYDFIILGFGKETSNSTTMLYSFTGKPKTVSYTSNEAQIWLKFASDRSGGRRGFSFRLNQVRIGQYECLENNLNCGNGLCVDESARCDGFNDCFNLVDEFDCVSGPGVESLEPGVFKGFRHLRTLSVTKSNITSIQLRTFDGLQNLTWLDLSSTLIAVVHSRNFEELMQLEGLAMWNVPLMRIMQHAFAGLSQLKTLVLVRGSGEILDVQSNGFHELQNLNDLYVDDHRICCYFTSHTECISLEPQSPLFSCGELMENTFLRICMWVLGLSAVCGNVFVVFWRLREKIEKTGQYVQSYLVMNLAISDCLMGIYMLILASVDVYYGSKYFQYAELWRSSGLCKIAGFLSLLSSEASVYFLVLISIDRFHGIVFPFSIRRFGKTSVKIITCLSWVGLIVLSLVPTLFADAESDFYGLSDVCIGLPLITKPNSYKISQGGLDSALSSRSFNVPVPQDQKPAWYFSIALFLGVNLLLFFLILLLYIVMFAHVQLSSRQSGRSKDREEEIKIAIKMGVIVATDFCCWMPIIIMGVLSQTGLVVIPVSVYAWSAVLIMPINSSLNPYLYTVSTMISASKNPKKTPVSNAVKTRSTAIMTK